MTRVFSRRHAAIVSVALAATTACADDTSRVGTTVTDSVGVRIVTASSDRLESLEVWSLDSSPIIEIGGGANPDYPLHQITDVQPLDNGHVAITTNNPTRGMVFGADGLLSATLGRGGDGPGEFANAVSVVPLHDDSLAVWDANRRRISVFTGGGFVRDVDVTDLVPQSPLAAASTLVPAAFTSALPAMPGTLVLVVIGVWGPGVPESGAYRLDMPSYHIDAAGGSLTTYGPFPGLELYKSEIGEVPLPFGADLHAATTDSSIVIGTAENPELRFYSTDGTLEQIARWPAQDRTVAGSELVTEFNDWLDTQLAQRDPREQALFREIIDAIPKPELFPAFDGVISGEGSQIWVGEYPGQLALIGLVPGVRRVPARQWLVLDGDGVLAASVQTPEGFQPHAVHDGRVWGVFTDELDVESVRAYSIAKT